MLILPFSDKPTAIVSASSVLNVDAILDSVTQGWRRLCVRHSLLSIFLNLFCPTRLLQMWKWCVYIHTSDCVETVYELPLLTNNTESETFLHKSRAVRSVDWIFIVGVKIWRWLGEYMTLDRTFYSLLFKQETVAAPSYCHIFFFIAFLEEVLIRNIIIILCINYKLLL